MYSVLQVCKNVLLYRRLRDTFIQKLEHYSIHSFTFYQLNYFLCKHNGNSNALSDFTCFVSVFWHAVWNSHKQCTPTLWPRNIPYRFLSSDKHYFNTFFTPSVSISIMSHLKNFCFLFWHQRELTLPASLIY